MRENYWYLYNSICLASIFLPTDLLIILAPWLA